MEDVKVPQELTDAIKEIEEGWNKQVIPYGDLDSKEELIQLMQEMDSTYRDIRKSYKLCKTDAERAANRYRRRELELYHEIANQRYLELVCEENGSTKVIKTLEVKNIDFVKPTPIKRRYKVVK